MYFFFCMNFELPSIKEKALKNRHLPTKIHVINDYY